MAEESSSSRKKESAVALTSSSNSTRQNDDVDDLVKSPSHSPNNSSTRKACYAVLQSSVSKKFMTGCVNAFVSDKEPVTPSSVAETQWPPHSSHIEREYEPEIDDSKRIVWSPDEDVVLAKSWATISTDAVIGNYKKDQTFWKRIGDYYNKHRPTGTVPRYWKRLKSHYYKFTPMVNEFSANYNNLYTHRQSGRSDENVLENALNMWKANNNNKDFKYMHVWRVLREYEYTPQSVSHHSSKKARTSESGGILPHQIRI